MGETERSKVYVPQPRVRTIWVVEAARDTACVGVLAGIVIALFWRAIFQGWHVVTPESGQAYSLAFPFFDYLHQRVHDQHQIPLWNPYLQCGTPFLPDSLAGVFSPLNFLLAIGDPFLSYTLICAAQLFLSGAFMYVFLRAISLGRQAALTGGVWYMMNGLFVGAAADRTFLAGCLFLPLLLATLHLAFHRRSWAWAGTTAVVWGMQVLAGNLQWDCLILATLFLYTLSCGAYEGTRIGRRLALFLLAILAGTALGGAQLLPTLDHIGSFDRPSVYAGRNFAHYGTLSNFLIPGMIPESNGLRPWIGTLGLLFALLSVRLRAVYFVKYFWSIVVAIVGGLVVLRVPAVQEALSGLPGFNEVYHPKALFLCVTGLAIVAAIRLDWTLTKERLDIEREFGVVLGMFLFVIVAGLLFLRDHAPIVGDQGTHIMRDLVARDNGPAAILIASGAILAALFWLGSGAVRWLVLPLAVVELFLPAALSLHFTPSHDVYVAGTDPPARDLHLRVEGGADARGPDGLVHARIANVNGEASRVHNGFASYMAYAEAGRGGEIGLPIRVTRAHHPFLAQAGVEYAWSEGWQFVGRDVTSSGKPIAARRAWFANLALYGIGKGTEDKLSMLQLNLDDEPDAVLLEEDLHTGPLRRQRSTIEFKEDLPERVALHVRCEENGLLVLADEFAPGWKAMVDGNERTIHVADLWMRAVEVPAGEHDVVFVYSPLSVRVGLLVSGIGGALVVLLWAFGLRRPVVQPIG